MLWQKEYKKENMFKELNRLVYLSSSFLLLSCGNDYKGKMVVISSHLTEKNLFSCSIVSQGQIIDIDSLLLYNNGELKEYQGCAAEGLYTFRYDTGNFFEDRDARNKTYYRYKNLDLRKEKNSIIFFNKSYIIQRTNKDSIFTKPDMNKNCMVFIGKIKD